MPNTLNVNNHGYDGSCNIHVNNDGINAMTVYTVSNHTLQAFIPGKEMVVKFSDTVGTWEIRCIVYEKQIALIGGWRIILWVRGWSWSHEEKDGGK